MEASLSSAKSGLELQECARKEAAEHASRAEACVSCHDYAGAIAAYEAAAALDEPGVQRRETRKTRAIHYGI